MYASIIIVNTFILSDFHYVVNVKTGVLDSKAFGKVSVSLVAGNNQTFGPIKMSEYV